MGHQVEFKAQGHEGPVLMGELLVQRCAAANVVDLLHTKNVDTLEVRLFLLFLLLFIDFHCFGFLLLLLHFLVFLLFLGLCLLGLFLCLFCSRLRFCHLLLVLLRLLGLSLLHQLGLVLRYLGLPMREDLLPGSRFRLEPCGGGKVFHPASELLFLDPFAHIIDGFATLAPLIRDVIEALLQVRDRELREASVQEARGHIGQCRLAELHLLLLRGEFHLWWLLVHLLSLFFLLFLLLVHFHVFLLLLFLGDLFSFGLCLFSLRFLLGLLSGFLHLFELLLALLLRLFLGFLDLFHLLLGGLLPGRLFLLHLELLVGLLLLLSQHELLAHLHEVFGSLADDDLGHLLVAAVKVSAQSVGPGLFDEVPTDLHDDVVSLLERGDGLNHPPNAHVVHLGDAEAKVRLIVAAHAFGGIDPTLLSPV
mmetsp:Transcript_12228/g.28936  ORF Transcript_12228/g.28936 Transcript_12228/m.28936 type:complete len:421 (+) Transcript_12228:736-1998(+)